MKQNIVIPVDSVTVELDYALLGVLRAAHQPMRESEIHAQLRRLGITAPPFEISANLAILVQRGTVEDNGQRAFYYAPSLVVKGSTLHHQETW